MNRRDLCDAQHPALSELRTAVSATRSALESIDVLGPVPGDEVRELSELGANLLRMAARVRFAQIDADAQWAVCSNGHMSGGLPDDPGAAICNTPGCGQPMRPIEFGGKMVNNGEDG